MIKFTKPSDMEKTRSLLTNVSNSMGLITVAEMLNEQNSLLNES